MRKSVYIETSIPSNYYDIRTDPQSIARKDWTQTWWHLERDNYEVFTSIGVIQELERGNHPKKAEKLLLVSGLKLLPVTQEIVEIVEVYINHLIMPADPSGDALHLATASYYKIDILLTWNCQHIANMKKIDHIRRINTKLGLMTPLLITPLNLIGDDNDK